VQNVGGSADKHYKLCTELAALFHDMQILPNRKVQRLDAAVRTLSVGHE